MFGGWRWSGRGRGDSATISSRPLLSSGRAGIRWRCTSLSTPFPMALVVVVVVVAIVVILVVVVPLLLLHVGGLR